MTLNTRISWNNHFQLLISYIFSIIQLERNSSTSSDSWTEKFCRVSYCENSFFLSFRHVKCFVVTQKKTSNFPMHFYKAEGYFFDVYSQGFFRGFLENECAAHFFETLFCCRRNLWTFMIYCFKRLNMIYWLEIWRTHEWNLKGFTYQRRSQKCPWEESSPDTQSSSSDGCFSYSPKYSAATLASLSRSFFLSNFLRCFSVFHLTNEGSLY